jgi:hypothetical protein
MSHQSRLISLFEGQDGTPSYIEGVLALQVEDGDSGEMYTPLEDLEKAKQLMKGAWANFESDIKACHPELVDALKETKRCYIDD